VTTTLFDDFVLVSSLGFSASPICDAKQWEIKGERDVSH